MNELTIKTNGHERELFAFCDLAENEKSYFSYIEGEDQFSPRLFRYRGVVYDTCEFMCTPKCDPARQELNQLSDWQGYRSDSFFSGVVIRYSEDFETVIAGTYYC